MLYAVLCRDIMAKSCGTASSDTTENALSNPTRAKNCMCYSLIAHTVSNTNHPADVAGQTRFLKVLNTNLSADVAGQTRFHTVSNTNRSAVMAGLTRLHTVSNTYHPADVPDKQDFIQFQIQTVQQTWLD